MNTPAGWKWPGNSRKAHYFLSGEVISLCGTWWYSGTTCKNQNTAMNKPGKYDCTPCWKLLQRGVVNGESRV